ncbi:hypothetical protein AB6A40_010571 [Gnathostoma spinigerum]|uniref:Uncharacterized protein n=1 Tax=Gnathostoma spinigerum TaxID=75299 RepID=A0ABD6EXN8_9BILA
MRLLVITTVLLVYGATAEPVTCPVEPDVTKCQVTWFAEVLVRSVKKIGSSHYSPSQYELEVIEGYKGVKKGEVLTATSRPYTQGGLNLKKDHTYMLSGLGPNDGKYVFGYCSQYLRGRAVDLDVKYMPKEDQQKVKKAILDCVPKPTIPPKPDEELTEKELLVKILHVLEALLGKLSTHKN